VTSTTHKTLRGPRGGIILTNDENIAKKINASIFPGMQGGPLMHVIAAKAVAFGEALHPSFKTYAQNVIDNIRILGQRLTDRGLSLITGGTDNHLVVVDLRPFGLKGLHTQVTLDHARITCNKNGIPFDTESPMTTSGIRLGSAAFTTRGFGASEFRDVGDMIADVLCAMRDGTTEKVIPEVAQKALAMCQKFPLYGEN
jgi:glycine hydroxymethyltransferase